MSRLICADSFIENLGIPVTNDMRECIEMMLERQPTVDPVEHGYWVFHPKMFEPPTCSECGVDPKTPGYLPTKASYQAWFKYCPNCGAKMDEVVEQ